MRHLETRHGNCLFQETAHLQYGQFWPEIERVAIASTIDNLIGDLKLV